LNTIRNFLNLTALLLFLSFVLLKKEIYVYVGEIYSLYHVIKCIPVYNLNSREGINMTIKIGTMVLHKNERYKIMWIYSNGDLEIISEKDNKVKLVKVKDIELVD
jgi:hypothetical protein